MLDPRVIYENENYLVLDKPSGWVVDKSSSDNRNKVIQNWIPQVFNFPISQVDEYRNGIVHRLDKDTSGILLVAKTPQYWKYLKNLFKTRNIEKVYIALVHGRVEGDGEISVPVGRYPWNRRKFGVVPGGRHASTSYKVETYFRYKKDNADYTLLKCYPKTGRTHQIRVHMKYLDHPIVSDVLYCGKKQYKKDKLWCPRLFLHAKSIGFKLPEGNRVEYQTQVPAELKSALSFLEKLN